MMPLALRSRLQRSSLLSRLSIVIVGKNVSQSINFVRNVRLNGSVIVKKNTTSGLDDIWMSTRQTIENSWDIPVNLGPIVNSTSMDGWVDISYDNLVLFFSSNQSGWDIWMAKRKSIEEDWKNPVKLSS
jgi:hypothetical protein